MPSLTAHSLWWDYVRSKWPTYALGFTCVGLCCSMQVLSARTVGWIIDFFSGKNLPSLLEQLGKAEVFLVLFLIMVCSRVLITLGRIGWRLTLGRLTHHAAEYLRSKVWLNACDFPRDVFNSRYSKGILMNLTNSDVQRGRFIFGFTLIGLSDVIFLTFFTVMTMIFIHPLMTLFSLIGFLALPPFIRKLADREGERYEKAQKALDQFNEQSSQAVSSIRLQKMTNTGDFWTERLISNADSYRKTRLAAVYTSLNFIPLMGGGTLITYLILFGYGISQVLEGHMTSGDFISMQGLIFLLQEPLMEVGFYISEWKKSKKSLKRLADVYNHPEDQALIERTSSRPQKTSILEVKDLSFRYSNEKPLFNKLNLRLEKGERLGLTGPIGSGKTTLGQILCGLERNIQGEVLYWGRTFQEYDHKYLRQNISLVHQRPFLFAQTIKQNICLDQKMDDDKIWHYLELAQVHEDVSMMPHQLETPLGEWGINLSGGQKQRLSLARALAREPQLLVLDDCVSAVDPRTEERILSGLDKDLRHVTILWIAHRLSTLKNCDRVLNLGEDL